MEYYILGNESLTDYMVQSLDSARERMSYAQTARHYERIIRNAPSFIFDNASDFLQAIKADYIVVLIKPNMMYRFEILSHDPERRRVIINDLEIIEVDPSEIEEIIIDHYPLEIKGH